MNDFTFSQRTITSIHDEIWSLSPYLCRGDTYSRLKELTQQLIEIYNANGKLEEFPFQSTINRSLSLPLKQLKPLLKGSTCLVTGGLGCIGSRLVKRLLELEVDHIIVIDKQPQVKSSKIENPRITVIKADICNAGELNAIFERYKPQYVFHTAAQRNPGYAEKYVAETVQTNVIGTLNVVNACEANSTVQQCVFTSTGKASRYYTDEVYAATKKLGEFIFDTYAAQSKVRYSMVRFTHVLDNSLMNSELQQASLGSHIAIHSPGKYVTAQNAAEAADLLLNALLYSECGRCRFLTVRNLDWPVESLEVALYYIRQSGNRIPVIFEGNPLGYAESFFRGQFDWANPQELNLLVNVYEYRARKLNEAGDIIISHINSTKGDELWHAITTLKDVKTEQEARGNLFHALQCVVRAALKKVDRNTTLDILQWGLQPQGAQSEISVAPLHGTMINLLKESVNEAEFLTPLLFDELKKCS